MYPGCEGKGELVFVIDTANHNDQHSFTVSQNVVKCILRRISHCVLPDSVRIGVIYCTQHDLQLFGLIGFQNAKDAAIAVGKCLASLLRMNTFVCQMTEHTESTERERGIELKSGRIKTCSNKHSKQPVLKLA